MNWDQIAGNWKQVKGVVREKWGKLTDDDVGDVIAGKRDILLLILTKHGPLALASYRSNLLWMDSLK